MNIFSLIISVFSFLFFLIVGFELKAETLPRQPRLPQPYATVSTQKEAVIVGWPSGKTPQAPPEFTVTQFSELPYPRSLLLLPSGNVLVAQSHKKPDDQGEKSPDRITHFQLQGSRIISQSTLLQNVTLPFGMAVEKDRLYVAEPTQVLEYPFVNENFQGAAKVIAKLPFPEPQRHWTRGLLINHETRKFYVSFGSPSDHGESPDPLDP